MVHRTNAGRRARRVGLGGALVAGLVLLGMYATTATGGATATPGKVFVCKYVGQPGVDERLQTGTNPISVSVDAIKDFQGLGSSFNDAQQRSLVLAYDVGQPEPSASNCPSAIALATTTTGPSTITTSTTFNF